MHHFPAKIATQDFKQIPCTWKCEHRGVASNSEFLVSGGIAKPKQDLEFKKKIAFETAFCT